MASEKPKGVAPPGKGVTFIRSRVVKAMDPALADAIRKPVPVGSIEAQTQPFQGAAPAPVIPPIKEKRKVPASSSASMVAMSLPAVESSEVAASKRKSRPATEATPDMRTQEDKDRPLAPDVATELDQISPLFAEYKLAQFQTETANPYLTDTVIYTPQTSRSFYRFVDDNYADDFRLLEKLKGQSDPEACNKLQTKTDGKAEAFLYQQFIREYIRTASPYRGILVYHGLGSGKTCSSIAAAEALYGTGNKKIIVMTPFSLRGNFISEVSFCGFRHYNIYNHWVAQPMDSVGSVTYLFARSVLSLPDDYLRRVIRRPDQAQRRIWLPDYSKPANYTALPSEDQNEIRTQITAMIESRIIFINYNGVGPKTLMRYACEKDADGNRLFDNAVIVIDEFHNLTRLMHGNIFQYITERKGRARTIPAEPIVPGRWEPKLCGSQLAYSRGFLYYRLLSDARNSKIIGLTGTPIINFPEELGILSNVLAGYTECVEFEIRETRADRLAEIRRIAEEEPRVDMVRLQREDLKTKVLISTFLEGYERAPAPAGDSKGVGVRYNAEAQDSIRAIFPRIREKFATAGIQIVGAETYVSYPRLPVDEDTFRANFVNEADLSIKNKVTLQKRLTGLISYYKGANEDYMPRVKKDILVECMLSDYALKMYTDARKWEMDIESSKQKEPTDIYSTVEMFAKMGNSSNYRSRSRAICNFAFPEAIQRPYPGTKADEKAASKAELTGINEDADVTEASYEELSDEDKAAIAQAQQEEMAVEKSVEEQGDEKQAGGMEDFMKQFSSMSSRMQNIAQPISNMPNRIPASEDEPEIHYRSANEEEDEDEEEEEDEDEEANRASVASVASVASASSGKSTTSNASSVSSTSSNESSVSSTKSNASSMRSKSDSNSDEEEEEEAEEEAEESNEEENELGKELQGVEVKESPFTWTAPTMTSSDLAAQMAALSTQMVKTNQPLTLSTPTVQNTPKPPAVRRKMPVFIEDTPPAPPVVEEEKKELPSIVPARAPRRKLPVFIEETPATTATTTTASVPLQQVQQLTDMKSAEAIGKSMTLQQKKEALAEKLRQKRAQSLASGKEELVASDYLTLLQAAMVKLENHRNDFLNLEDPVEEKRLVNYSAKLDHMIRNLNDSKGSNLVYSQFKMVEGLGVLALALRANGYVEIKLEGSDENPTFSRETEESLRKGPAAKEKRFIMFTGDGSKERRTLILNIFNGNFDKLPRRISQVLKESGYEAKANLYGDICWVIGITGAGAEGISLKCCRSVHIMEPYWNNVRLDQVKGRAIRICSHKDLPYEERDVEIYTYCTVFTKEQLGTGKIDLSLIQTDKGETSDQKVYNVSKLKDTINQGILQIMKEAAVDCDLNAADNDGVRCFRIEDKRVGAKSAVDRPDMYLFDPNLTIDIAVTNMYFKDVEESYPTTAAAKKEQAVSSVLRAPAASATASASAPAASEEKITIRVIAIRGKEFYITPSRNSPDTTYEIFDRKDRRLMNPIGVAFVNPAAPTLAFSGYEFTDPSYLSTIESPQ